MISSRIFTAMLRYDVKSNNFTKSCEQLKEKVKNLFEDDEFIKLASIITADYSIKIDKRKDPEVDIVVIIYATVDSTVETNKGFAKLMELYIDTHCGEVTFNDVEAKLIKRRVI